MSDESNSLSKQVGSSKHKFRRLEEEIFTIVKVEIRGISKIFYDKPFLDASMGPFTGWEPFFIRLVDKSGYVGECEFPKLGIFFFEELLLPTLLSSKGESYKVIYDKMYWNIRNEGFRGSAALILGHIDRAFYDLASKREHLPLYRYLGGVKSTVTAYGSGLGTNVRGTELLEEAISWEERGFRTVKMKFSGFDTSLSEDIKRVKTVREVLSPGTKLAIDANQVMNLGRAIEFLKELERTKINIEWVEEPIHSGAFKEIKKLCDQTELTISFGESERTSKTFPSLVEAGVGHLQPVPGHICSVGEYYEVLELAKGSSCMVSSGGNSFYNATFMAGRDGLLEYLEPILGPIREVYSICPKIVNGTFELLEEPGFGVEVNWEKMFKDEKVCFVKSWKED